MASHHSWRALKLSLRVLPSGGLHPQPAFSRNPHLRLISSPTHPSYRHHYATDSPPKPRNVVPSVESIERYIKREEIYQKHTAQEYYDCLKVYEAAVMKRAGGKWWAATFPSKKDRPSNDMLYKAACIVDVVDPTTSINFGIWAFLAGEKYTPAIISMGRHISQMRFFNEELYRKHGIPPHVKRAEGKYKALVKQGTDPNALTTEAEELLMHGQTQAAIKMLQQALTVGSDGFEWDARCKQLLAKAYIEVDRLEDGEKILRSILHVDMEGTELELGKALAQKSPEESREWLYLGAAKLDNEATKALMDHELGLAMEARNEEETAFHMKVREEWQRLAVDNVRRMNREL